MNTQKQVMVFGVFDGFDEGHQYFLKQAKALGDRLIVVVADDAAVGRYKSKSPMHTQSERIQSVEDSRIADVVISGDAEPHSWNVLEKYKPSVIACGFDQHELRTAIEKSGLSVTITEIPKQ